MYISYERTGGFAGMRLAVSVESGSLPAADADALQKLVKAADFFNLTDAQPARAIPDGFQYTISVEDGGKQHTLHLHDGAIPDKLQPLLDDLSQRARSKR